MVSGYSSVASEREKYSCACVLRHRGLYNGNELIF